MKLYVTRHGETDWNRQWHILGDTDIPLNETGLAQAARLAGSLQALCIDTVIASPMRRALATAQAAAGVLEVPLLTDERLREQSYGSFEGMSGDNTDFKYYKTQLATRMPGGGESAVQVCHRVYSLLDELRGRYAGQTVLLVTHGAICRAAHSYFNNMTNEQYANFKMQNCELREYTL